ncbi:helix-turn-helix transcriptional regulator [Phenylobacterium sp.]|uniref:helix-turn-helix transcriptional regulator n=1 Tax=Phenylobacterium sp. TaxID=1871053 RepID=UPI00262871FF|nr:helix-turn-helix transcriptional regulator [Phenylobacterium sp.]
MPDRRLIVRLKAARTEAGLTQAELALKVGVSRKTINTVENGVFVPSTILALGLAQALGLTVEALFSLAPDLSSDL